jgi:aminopeptidase N
VPEYCHRLMELENGVTLRDPRFLLPSSRPHYAPDRDFDSTHIKLELKVDIALSAIEGTCTTTLRAFHDGVKEAAFDAVEMKIKAVSVAGRKARYKYDKRKLRVTLPRAYKAGEEVSLAVHYRVEKPKLGIYFIRPEKAYPDTPTQVWTQGQDEYSRYWYPCHDAPQEKATTEMIATVPQDFTAISNGGLVKVTVDKTAKTKTFHWRMSIPHSTYLVTLAAGRWVELRDSWAGIPITYYTEKGKEKRARLAFGKTPRMVKFFSEAIGVKYPYEKYAQVAAANFIYGGMENTTATTQTDLVLCDERAYAENWHEGLVAHELAHQWFGDLLTCKDWSHAWLNESFATYFDALYDEHDHGDASFRYHMLGNARNYFGEDKERYRRPIVTNVYKEPSDIFDRHLYEKGSTVLHMLRYVLGDELWWRSIKTYVEDNRGKSVETLDLINAIEKATGRNMRWFFDQWIFKAGHPEYKVTYTWDPKKKEASVWIVQSHRTDPETGLFKMPLVFEFELPNGRRKQFKEMVEKKEQTFTWKLDKEPRLFRFDPGNWVLKHVTVVKPRKMWFYQLEHDRDPMGRIAAAHQLAKVGSQEAVEALARALEGERFWGVQIEIAKCLADTETEEAYRALVKALKIKNVKARRAVVESVGSFRRPQNLEVLKGALEAKDSYFVPVAACQAVGKARTKGSRALLEHYLKVDSWNDWIRQGAIDGLAALNSESVIDRIKERTTYGYHQLSRLSAVRGLGALGKGRPDVVNHLIELTGDKFLRVQITSIMQLGRIGDPRAVEPLRKLADGEDVEGRIRRAAEEALRQIREGLDTGPDVDALRKENEELKKRLKKVEGGARKAKT